LSQSNVTRRAFCSVLAATAALMDATAAPAEPETRGPLLWRASRGRARVYLFPFGQAKDSSWLTPTIQRAFEESSQLWVELGKPLTPKRRKELYKELGEDPARSFFDGLDPRVSARATSYMRELGIPRESVEPLRPWLAYYTFATAYDKKYGHSQGLTESSPSQTPPDFVLIDRALKSGKSGKSGKTIHSEITMEDWLRKLAALPDKLQSEYLEWLFDYFDDQKAGLGADRFGWMQGKPSERSNERMRTKMPNLYEVMDTQRNEWWARQIVNLLAEGGTSFIVIGQNHVLGPKGIPRLLTDGGLLRAGEWVLV
jgi:uncharacterized protein YbaP (TraB family)